MKRNIVKIATLVAASFMLVTASQADIVKVAPCNHLVDDAHFEPGLRLVINGRTTYYPVGEQGLTRSIVYNEVLAKAWVEEVLGLGGNPIRYQETCYPKVEDSPLPPEEPQEPEYPVDEIPR